MSEIIIDSVCILEFLLNRKSKEVVQNTVGKSRLLAPDCLPCEIGNAVSKLIKKSLITVVDGVAVYHELARIPIRFIEPDIPSSIVIAGESGCSAYEAYYISLAKQLSLPLFTMNENMKEIAISRGVKCL
ncbi:Predicted nucleic acid-binding protein, contains PIN domain [Treponema bryantii]|uniref:Predicted nucleic acid-binding protein, contains PIN domain n=1 Tax=Treponema bryantii TaxID=163 RepID=A0A1I3MQ38_9SPIR|nr:type II toxin-antitoxin system VapC family toxin [Treponema bryantii]SFI99128.1 Predicted nucleic acid-binding protein, contains PIN domain [Treponema bryantii]